MFGSAKSETVTRRCENAPAAGGALLNSDVEPVVLNGPIATQRVRTWSIAVS
jgi:hypothetical protein